MSLVAKTYVTIADSQSCVNAAYGLSDRYRVIQTRSPHALVYLLNCPPAQAD